MSKQNSSSHSHSSRLFLPTAQPSTLYSTPQLSLSSPTLGQLQKSQANARYSIYSLSKFSLMRVFKKTGVIASEFPEEITVNEPMDANFSPISFKETKPITVSVRKWESLSLEEMKLGLGVRPRKQSTGSFEESVLDPLNKFTSQQTIDRESSHFLEAESATKSRNRAFSAPPIQTTPAVSVKRVSPLSPIILDDHHSPLLFMFPDQVDTIDRDISIKERNEVKVDFESDNYSLIRQPERPKKTNFFPNLGRPKNNQLLDKANVVFNKSHPANSITLKRNSSLERCEADGRYTKKEKSPERGMDPKFFPERVSISDIPQDHKRLNTGTDLLQADSSLIETPAFLQATSLLNNSNENDSSSIVRRLSLQLSPINISVLIPSPTEKFKTLSVSPARSPQKFFTTIDFSHQTSNEQEQDLAEMKKWAFEKDAESLDVVSPSLTGKRKSIKRNTLYRDSHVALTLTAENIIEETDVLEGDNQKKVEETLFNDTAENLIDETIFASLNLSNEEENPKVSMPILKAEDPILPVFNTLKDDRMEGTVKDVVWTPSRPTPAQKSKKPWKWLVNLFEPKLKSREDASAQDEWNPYPEKPLPSRLSEDVETKIYSQSHVKLAQSNRPLLQQVQISNFMMYILSVHSSVTIKGRGPQIKRRKKRRRKTGFSPPSQALSSPFQQPLMFALESKSPFELSMAATKPAPLISKLKRNGSSSSSSSSEEGGDIDSEIEGVVSVQVSYDEDEDEIPLALLLKNKA